MATPTSYVPYVPIVQAEAKGLGQFLDTLSADDWQRPSACDLWAIRDVVAHLIWAADFYTDSISRGMQGDISQPADVTLRCDRATFVLIQGYRNPCPDYPPSEIIPRGTGDPTR